MTLGEEIAQNFSMLATYKNDTANFLMPLKAKKVLNVRKLEDDLNKQVQLFALFSNINFLILSSKGRTHIP